MKLTCFNFYNKLGGITIYDRVSKRDIRWKWLQERGFNVLADRHQYALIQSLWSPTEIVQAVFCEAKAGTGKTTIAVLAGAYEIEIGNYSQLIYVRNSIPIRDQGFLPGEQHEKEAPYIVPFKEALEYVHPGTFSDWVSENPPLAVATTTSFARGINWNNAFVIIDEAQNFELDELQAVYTRCDDDCKVVTLGSLRQIDNTKVKRYGNEKLTPFEVFMKHFEDRNVTYHKLETNYRGDFANHADEVKQTVDELEKKEVD